MTLRNFRSMCLQGRALPSTHALHFFAAAVGTLSAVEAAIIWQPMIFAVGISLGYAVAVAAHWLVLRRQPLVTASARSDHLVAAPRGNRLRLTLLAVSTAGLTVALLDLDDIVDAGANLHYPIIQLGVPIVAFAAACAVGAKAFLDAWTTATAGRADMPSSWRRSEAAAAIASSLMSRREESLWRAYLALLAIGMGSLAIAEMMEHDLPMLPDIYWFVGVPAGLMCGSIFLLRQLVQATRPRS